MAKDVRRGRSNGSLAPSNQLQRGFVVRTSDSYLAGLCSHHHRHLLRVRFDY